MSAWGEIVRKSFIGNQGILNGHPDVLTNAGTPHSSVTAGEVGTLCWDTSGEDGYIKTAQNSTWVKINA